LISLSLLPTAHPPSFQPWWVRASTKCYQRFTLAMGRSLGFASANHDFRPIQTRFPCGSSSRLSLAMIRNSLAHYAKGTRSLALPLFVGTRFQVLFHSPLGVLFTFPSRYWSTIGQSVVLSLGGWSPQLPPGFHVSEGTQEHRRARLVFVYGAITLYRQSSQTVPLTSRVPCSGPTTPTRVRVGLGYSAFARRY
jgi:hypothetical protein